MRSPLPSDPPPVFCEVRAVNVFVGAIAPVLELYPIAPITNSSDCVVGAVLPELGVVLLPVAVATWSVGETATPLNAKKLATLSNGTGVGNVTVIVPLFKALVTRAEYTSVRTPVRPDPLVTSASLV